MLVLQRVPVLKLMLVLQLMLALHFVLVTTAAVAGAAAGDVGTA